MKQKVINTIAIILFYDGYCDGLDGGENSKMKARFWDWVERSMSQEEAKLFHGETVKEAIKNISTALYYEGFCGGTDPSGTMVRTQFWNWVERNMTEEDALIIKG